MENYKINHELNQYDYSEGIEFKGLLPELMEAEGVKTIGALAFCNCESLKQVKIPESVTTIMLGTFSGSGWCRIPLYPSPVVRGLFV